METASETGDLRFAKQFLVAPGRISHNNLNGWTENSINSGMYLYTHPELILTHFSDLEKSFWGLGIFLDPHEINADDATILRRLAESSSNFSQLELLLSNLGGRWVLIATIGRDTRVYHDAAGQKSVFIYPKSRTELYVCSHPNLLHALEVAYYDRELAEKFAKFKNSGSWPIRQLPYKGVTQLLPNYYLELDTGRTKRYWPNRTLERNSTDDAAEEMLDILRGIVGAAICRRECTISLSGGYDSRLVLASAVSYWNKVKVYTIGYKDAPRHDISIPKKLSRRHRLKYSVAKLNFGANSTNASNSDLNDALQKNVGGMFFDPSIRGTQTVRNAVGNTLNLPGLISATNKCGYYRNGVHPSILTPWDIAVRAGFKDNPIAEEGFAIWLNEVPPELPINLLDLAHWEHRHGVWSACSMTFREGIIDAIPPMNCRRFLELGLSTDIEARKYPHALIRRMIYLANPELLDLEFNHDWLDDWNEFRLHKLPIPWRLKKGLGWV